MRGNNNTLHVVNDVVVNDLVYFCLFIIILRLHQRGRINIAMSELPVVESSSTATTTIKIMENGYYDARYSIIMLPSAEFSHCLNGDKADVGTCHEPYYATLSSGGNVTNYCKYHMDEWKKNHNARQLGKACSPLRLSISVPFPPSSPFANSTGTTKK